LFKLKILLFLALLHFLKFSLFWKIKKSFLMLSKKK
jgi:hypothetical protein